MTAEAFNPARADQDVTLTVTWGGLQHRLEIEAADWALIADIAAARQVPVIGNGDLLTHYEVRRLRARCHKRWTACSWLPRPADSSHG